MAKKHAIYVGTPWANNGIEEVGIVVGDTFFYVNKASGSVLDAPDGTVFKLRELVVIDPLTSSV